MKLGSDGRLWPERAVEHLIFWPLIATGAVGLYFMAKWLSVIIDPYTSAFVDWLFGS